MLKTKAGSHFLITMVIILITLMIILITMIIRMSSQPDQFNRPGRLCSLIEKTKVGQSPQQISNHQQTGCLSEAGIALDDGLRGNKSQEEMGNRVNVEQP